MLHFIILNQNRQKSSIDSGASISVINEHSVLKTCHIWKCNKSIKNLFGQLNILERIFTDIEIGGIKTMERLVVISKEHKMPDDVISGSNLLAKSNAHIDYSKINCRVLQKKYHGQQILITIRS